MALRGASTTTDTDFIDWMGLAVEGAAVCCTVKTIEPSHDYGNGELEAPRAQVIVLTGKQAGAVYANELVLKAGIRNKLSDVGDTIVGRMATYSRGKQVYPCLNSEQDGDIELAEKALAKFAGTDQNEKPAKTSKKAKPADDDEDDEAPF